MFASFRCVNTINSLSNNMSLSKRKSNLANRPSYQQLEARNLLACDLVGTAGDDLINVQIGAQTVDIEINGTVEHCARNEVINIDALGGHDRITIVDDAGDDLAVLRVGSVSIDGAVQIGATNVEAVSITSGGGMDRAILLDSQNADELFGSASNTLLRGAGFEQRVIGYDEVFAVSSNDTDVAYISDSPGNDVFVGGDTSSRMMFPESFIGLTDFSQVYARSDNGGNDQVVFSGSEGDDALFARGGFARITNGRYTIGATNFERILANQSEGIDRAVLLETANKDQFYGTPDFAHFKFGSHSQISMVDWERVTLNADSHEGRIESAYVYGSEGNDQFNARRDQVIAIGDDFEFYIAGMTSINFYAEGGTDTARFFDFIGTGSFMIRDFDAQIYWPTTYAWIGTHSVEKVIVTGIRSHANSATLIGESNQPNQFYATPFNGRMDSPNWQVHVRGFRNVSALASGDDDVAYITGSDLTEELRVWHIPGTSSTSVILKAANRSYEIQSLGFGNTYVNVMGGLDSGTFGDSPYNDTFYNRGNVTSIESNRGGLVSVTGLNFIDFFSNEGGGTDRAFLYGTESDNRIEGDSAEVIFVGEDLRISVQYFEFIYATDVAGGNNVWAVDEFDNPRLFRLGNWVDG